MNKLNRISIGLALYLAAFLAMAIIAPAQEKLRNALDFDGDDKADYAVSRANNNTWYIQKSSDGSLNAVMFGINDYDTLTPGDYDGDGKTDLAVWRETEGNFYYLRSLDNTITGGSWGVISDLPIASYDTH